MDKHQPSPFPSSPLHAVGVLQKIKAFESINTGNEDMDMPDPVLHWTSRDQGALPSPVSGSEIVPGMRQHS